MSTSSLSNRTESGVGGLGALGQLLPDALVLVTTNGIVIEANPAAARIFGRDPPSLGGTPMADLIAPGSDRQLSVLLHRCARSGSLVPGSLRLETGDGHLQDYQVQGAALNPSGSPILLLLRTRQSIATRFRLLTEKLDELASEVSSRRRAESVLEHQLQILQLIVTAAPLEAILDGLVRFAEMHGSSGLFASILLLDDDGQRLLTGAAPSLPPAYNDAINGVSIGPNVGSCGTAAFLNTPVFARDIESDPRWQDYKDLALVHGLRSCWSTPIPSPGGSVLGTFALYYEMPKDPPMIDRQVVEIATRLASIAIERKREEEQIKSLLASERLARADAESANRAKDDFLALISHELRNPLNAILGWTRLLQIGDLDEETYRQAIDTIERNVDLQSQLIEDVLDFSRANSGHLKLDLKPTCIAEVVEDAIDSMLPDAETAGIRLDLHVADVVESACDSARLHQVMTNLISNAIKFTPAGGRISTRIDRIDGLARIAVTDTGAGIETDFLPHVFDPFRQADGSFARSHSGLGLGLAVVRRIVELHGGHVSAHSDGKGKGSTFVVHLPLGTSPAPAVSDPRARPTDADVSGLRVLVIDDEPDARELIGTILRRHGAHPTLAASAAEAAQVLDAGGSPGSGGAFDVLISDVAMPGADGYSLIRAVRARSDRYASIPAAALTAHARESDRARAHAAGYDRHLSKPVEPGELLTAISELAREVRARQD